MRMNYILKFQNSKIFASSLQKHLFFVNANNTLRCISTSSRLASEVVKNQNHEVKLQEESDKTFTFVKDLFLGKFNREVLTYPEAISQERYSALEDILPSIKYFFQDEVESQKIDEEESIPPEILQRLKELGLFGMQIPEEFGGRGLNNTEYSRVTEEVSRDVSIAEIIFSHHDLASKVLLAHGSESQKSKYLSKLAKGECIATVCLTEAESWNDVGSVDVTAEANSDESGFFLNGSKIWVPNGMNSDIFIVFSVVKKDVERDKTRFPTVFLVERNSEGVSVGEKIDKIGARGCQSCTVKFSNTPVPNENVVGGVGGAFDVATSLFEFERLSTGNKLIGIMKRLLNEMVPYCTSLSQFGNKLSEYGSVREQLTLLETDLYAMESMSYLTSGFKDVHKNHDCVLEAAIFKSFSLEKSLNHILRCIQILGYDAYQTNHPLDRTLRDVRSYSLFENSVEMPKLFIALHGLQHAGPDMSELIEKIRNPFQYPDFILKRNFNRFITKDRIKLDMLLYEYLHPTLKPSADILETCTKMFENAVFLVFSKDGKRVAHMSNQFNLFRLADIVSDIFALTAVLGRASRSYCIGLHKSEHEIELANIFALQVQRRVKAHHQDIQISLTEDYKTVKKVTDEIFNTRGYVCEPAIKKIYW